MKKTYDKASLQPPVSEPKEQKPKNYDAQVEQFLIAGMHALHSPETRDGIVEKLSRQTDPVKGLKNVALNVIMILEAKAKQEGKFVDPVVVAQAGPRIMDYVIEIAEESDVLPSTDEQRSIALGSAVQDYVERAKKEGRVTDEDLQKGAAGLAKKDPESVAKFQALMDKHRMGLENGTAS